MPTTSSTKTYNDILTSVLEDRSPGYVDQIEKQLPWFWWLKRTGNYKPAEGEVISWAVRYTLGTAASSYQGLDTFGMQGKQVSTLLIASWKQYEESIIIAGLDKNVKNKGPKIFDLLEMYEETALANLQESMGQDFYLDGTGNNSKDVTGLAAIVPEDPTTGTIFGINRATAGNEWARSQNVDHGAAAAYSISAAARKPGATS